MASCLTTLLLPQPTLTNHQWCPVISQLSAIRTEMLNISILTWWRHQMETFSALLAICAGNSPVPGEFPPQRPVTWSFGVFFDLCLNKRLRKQSRSWWFETLSCPLWRHRNENRYPNFTHSKLQPYISGDNTLNHLYHCVMWIQHDKENKASIFTCYCIHHIYIC